MFPIHVLYIRPGVYEVCSDDGRFSREFSRRKDADIYADALRAGKSDLDALALVEANREKRKARNLASRSRAQLMRDLGLSRNRDGSWE